MTTLETWTDVLRAWAPAGALIARMAVGALFAISGGQKLLLARQRRSMRQTMKEAAIPAPGTSATLVSLVEITFGTLLMIGLATPIACIMLSGVMIVALWRVVLPGVAARGPVAWLGEVLYLPEVLYLVILVWLLLAGPGWLSVDGALRPS